MNNLKKKQFLCVCSVIKIYLKIYFYVGLVKVRPKINIINFEIFLQFLRSLKYYFKRKKLSPEIIFSY